MVAGSILPITLHEGKVYFLFGKENPMEDSAKGFSDFGGRIEKKETPFQGALREGAEELSGFLGDKHQLRKLIKKQGKTLNHVHRTYHVHMFYYPYDENLVTYYNQNHKFLWENMDKIVLNESKLFEKIEIQWFPFDKLQEKMSLFRPFYKTIVLELMERKEEIISFLKKKQHKHNKTVKRVV
jgi:8-oxo-dGTP pyrophosphatase MutT (NUDIX family)